jgi:hypothetical protein
VLGESVQLKFSIQSDFDLGKGDHFVSLSLSKPSAKRNYSYITTPGQPYYTFNKAAQSKGSTFVTCTAMITQTAPVNPADPNCSFSLRVNMEQIRFAFLASVLRARKHSIMIGALFLLDFQS